MATFLPIMSLFKVMIEQKNIKLLETCLNFLPSKSIKDYEYNTTNNR